MNEIVRRYATTRSLGSVNPQTPQYGDFTGPQTLLEAYTFVRQAEANFMKLPAKVREACNNDPTVFAEMMTDEGAVEFLKKHGLVVKEPTQKPETPTPDPTTPVP